MVLRLLYFYNQPFYYYLSQKIELLFLVLKYSGFGILGNQQNYLF